MTHLQPPKSSKLLLDKASKSSLSVDDVLAIALQLSRTQREELAAALTQSNALEPAPEPLPDAETTPDRQRSRRGRSARVEAKLIKGCGPYYYYRWWSGKTYRSTYLGKTPPAV